MQATEIAGLMFAAAAAGVVNAVAGGGTLLTFPSLILFGTPPVVANATSTLALVFGTSGSVFGYRRHLDTVKPWLRRFIPVSIIGGVAGGVLLTRTSSATFSKLVPFLILFSTLIFLSQGAFRRFALKESAAANSAGRWMFVGALLFQFVVSVYGGYFGAGIGILMLASLGFIGLNNIHEMNTVKTVLGSLINLVAAVWFIGAGLINWPEVLVMTPGAVAGYFLGSHFSQRIPQLVVRRIITGTGFALAALMFYKEFCAP